ncbi:MAG: hypothetical protein KGL95_12505, partial [Patescibacteria group bacterium]|nr:hypothetical protein [Patescibacteria group bacterium]
GGVWCNTTPTPFPTPIHCGGFVRNAPVCPTGYICQLGKIPDTGGICIPSVTNAMHRIPVAVGASMPTSPLVTWLSGFKGFFTHVFFFWRR